MRTDGEMDRQDEANSRLSHFCERAKIYWQRYLMFQSVPRSKHSSSFTKTNQLTLYREIIAVCSEIQTEHIITLCGQNVEFFNVKPGGIYSCHCGLKGQHQLFRQMSKTPLNWAVIPSFSILAPACSNRTV